MPSPLPSLFRPQLATLVSSAPEGDGWLHEMKFDGYRIGCRVDGKEVCLFSRNGKDWTASFPEVRDAVLRLKARRVFLDGEVAMVLPDGRTSFQALQNVFTAGPRVGLVYLVFDLLHLEGDDVSRRPLEERKALLRALVTERGEGGGILRYAEHVVGGGPAFFQQACRLGLEGAISKRRDQPYQPGRGPGWVKTKCIKRQELVIAGFTEPEGSRVGVGALLLGFYQGGDGLVFAGKVGTGFTQKVARDLRGRLERLEQPTCPFTVRPVGVGGKIHWVRPELVAEVAFTEWTGDGKIRHPSFQGLRRDKAATEVVRERAREEGQKRVRPSRRGGSGAEQTVAGVRISHPERVVYPALSVTKLDLARFYEAIAGWIVPHLAGRPLTLVRCPTGVGPEEDGKKDCSFMKHSKVWAPAPLRQVRIQEQKKLGQYLIADTPAAVVALVQMDIVEIHTWNSTAEAVEQPNRIVFDLDPGPDVPWRQVVEAARLVRAALESLGLESFVKTTGGNGLHVVVPLAPALDWADCLAFSRGLAEAVVHEHPTRYTTALAKAGRERMILIDYLRNNRTNTSVAAYSTRARPHGPLSVPLAWDELAPRLRPERFTVLTVPRRLASLGADPWEAYARCRQRISPRALAALARR
jgi:bifunctional non-homologous end joining protein LigD